MTIDLSVCQILRRHFEIGRLLLGHQVVPELGSPIFLSKN